MVKPAKKKAKKPKANEGTTAKGTRGEGVLWEVIARVGKKSRGGLSAAIVAFEKELAALDDATLQRVEAAFVRAMKRANNWDLWGASYLIHGGSSDDMFWDVRAGIVALGRNVFEAALEHPDSLASVKDIVSRSLYEGFQYVPDSALELRGLKSTYKRPVGGPRLSGKPWDMEALRAGNNEALHKRFPRLAKRFST
jgi:Protein of unknown function (DUF4240)